MSEPSWTDQIVGERMTVDQEFSTHIQDSQFSNQEWSLIMTATTFEIEQPDDPEQARMVANTDQVDQVIPELENIQSSMGAMGAEGGSQPSSSGGGIVDSIKGALGFSGTTDSGSDEAKLEAAEDLTQKYAAELQSHLESNGRWESVREAASPEE
ncbi:hypothetical protein EA462_14970 [Natrarchaeobius halalkaliphilus]|uniref:Uncharacterized protein n=1 Tax=Natrarchaeobius halalkaliphilus TaxID=1679091 RepID=A0A3N6M477_9EURY|nr:DUF5799 family protein [Natrarchaeobius halalkaliphilus]RQG86957.1 hypothetical protein EA462_14970 [Natrarchaeobius halalkaliphilus]